MIFVLSAVATALTVLLLANRVPTFFSQEKTGSNDRTAQPGGTTGTVLYRPQPVKYGKGGGYPDADGYCAETVAMLNYRTGDLNLIRPGERPVKAVDKNRQTMRLPPGFRNGETVTGGGYARWYRAERDAEPRRVLLRLPAPETAADNRLRRDFINWNSMAAKIKSTALPELLYTAEYGGIPYAVYRDYGAAPAEKKHSVSAVCAAGRKYAEAAEQLTVLLPETRVAPEDFVTGGDGEVKILPSAAPGAERMQETELIRNIGGALYRMLNPDWDGAGEPPPLWKARPETDLRTADFIGRMMTAQPGEPPESLAEIISFFTAETTKIPPTEEKRKRRNGPLNVWLAAALAAAAAGYAGIRLYAPAEEPDDGADIELISSGKDCAAPPERTGDADIHAAAQAEPAGVKAPEKKKTMKTPQPEPAVTDVPEVSRIPARPADEQKKKTAAKPERRPAVKPAAGKPARRASREAENMRKKAAQRIAEANSLLAQLDSGSFSPAWKRETERIIRESFNLLGELELLGVKSCRIRGINQFSTSSRANFICGADGAGILEVAPNTPPQAVARALGGGIGAAAGRRISHKGRGDIADAFAALAAYRAGIAVKRDKKDRWPEVRSAWELARYINAVK